MPVVSSQNLGATPARAADDVSRILKIRVPVIVQLGRRRITLSEVLNLAQGAVLELGKASDENLHLLVNNKVVGEGEAVKVGENFGLRVTQIGSLRDRVDAMGG